MSDIRGLPFRTAALRGGGVPSKADIVSNLSKGVCVNLQTGGSTNLKFLRTSLMEAPLPVWRLLQTQPARALCRGRSELGWSEMAKSKKKLILPKVNQWDVILPLISLLHGDMDWKNHQVWPFSSCCSADFCARRPVNQLYNNKKIDKPKDFDSPCKLD